ncbi:MAG: SRPBCC family protein [Acidobacteriota bacterium]
METRSVTHSTFVIERSYSSAPEQVFAAFGDPVKKRRWFVESENLEVEEFEMDFRVGGNEHARYRFKEGTPFAGMLLNRKVSYQDIVPNRRSVFAYTMSIGDQCMSVSLATIEFLPAEQGTDLIFTEQGAYFAGADGPQMREGGWRKLFERLTAELTR